MSNPDQPSSGWLSTHTAPPTRRPGPVRQAGRCRPWQALLLGIGCLAAGAPGVGAEVRLVGPERDLRAPSDAAAVAQDGDVVRIDPGEYVDCAIWRANGLVLQAPDGAAHVRDRACGGKAIWVIQGADVTVDNITFSGSRVPDQNGAGIRAEGRDLTVRNSRFLDNENGILSAPVEDSTIVIEGSIFERNGKCAANCAHGIYVSRIERLKVVDSVFREQRQGHHIKSAAGALEVTGSTIEDGPDGTASYLIDVVSGGEVVIADNLMHKGPKAENRGTAISIAGEGATSDAPAYRISGNRFRSDTPGEVAFVRNRTIVPAVLSANRLEGEVVPLVGPGSTDADQETGAPAIARDETESQPAAAEVDPAAGPAGYDDLEAKLRLLRRLYEDELITEEEYAAKKAQLLKDL